MLKGKQVFVVVFLMVSLFTAGCEKKTKFYQGVGTLEEINRQMKTLQINHEPIEGYMPAMSMPYKVKDPALLDAVKQGDRVEFSIEDGSAGIFLTDVKKVEK